jgi:thiamine pyrophosphokinase
MRAIIFVNGQFSEPQYVHDLICPDDYVIAVNGGTRHALRMGIVPHVVIGDLHTKIRPTWNWPFVMLLRKT